MIGSFNILDSYELGDANLFSSGVVAVAQATDAPQVLLEHVFTGDKRVIPVLHRMLLTGLNLRFDRTVDLSAVVNVSRLKDGRLQFTASSSPLRQLYHQHWRGNILARTSNPLEYLGRTTRRKSNAGGRGHRKTRRSPEPCPPRPGRKHLGGSASADAACPSREAKAGRGDRGASPRFSDPASRGRACSSGHPR